MRTPSVCLATATLILVATAAPVQAFDLTGHWIGKWSCRDFDGVKFKEGMKPSSLEITQTGGTMSVRVDNFGYNGVAIVDAKKPGEKGQAVWLSCPTRNVLTSAVTEIVRATVKTKLTGSKGTIAAISIFADNIGNVPEVGTCRYSYKRVDTVDPVLTACP
jgi:hypothetical protein